MAHRFTRSHAPVFWLLFGAGGMLAALLGPGLVLVTLLAPQGWGLSADLFDYPRMLAFGQHWFAKGLLFAVVSLFAWHAVHRILCTLHDFGIHKTFGVKVACYGIALSITGVAAYALLAIGF